MKHAMKSAAALLPGLLCTAAFAQGVPYAPNTPTMPPASVAAVPRGPWVPPAQRLPSTAVHTRGAALQAQVQQKLRADFARADLTGSGRITRAQAQAAGLGAVAEHFDAIDRARSGSISWSDWQAYLRTQGGLHP